jgi:hypothetical protein
MKKMNHRFKQKVSPGVEALGVEAVFPGLRSPAVEAPRIREVKKDAVSGVTQPSANGGRGTQANADESTERSRCSTN